MTIPHTVRAAEPRALVGAAALGSIVGLAIGGAYLAGGLARAAVSHAHIQALAAHVDGSFSEAALKASAGDAGVLAIARQREGVEATAQDLADRRMARLALQTPETVARIAKPGSTSATQQVAVAAPTGQAAKLFQTVATAAAPFHMAGALDSSRDLECLTAAVYYEARGESAAGQQAVAQVVLNRARHPAFPKSVCGVVFQHAGGGCQFSFACDGSMSRRHEGGAWDRAKKVAADALDGHVLASIGTATHFHVASLGNVWSTGMLKVAQIGSHVFYRFGGAAGAPKMFHAEPQPSAPSDGTLLASARSRVVTASFVPAGADQAAGRLISASTAVVERAAAAVESVAKPKAAETARSDAKPEAAPATKVDTAAATTSPAAS